MLCRTLGCGRWAHPDEMLADLTYEEFEDWIDVYNLAPWGEDRADMRMARLVWATLSPHSKKKLDENTYRFKFVKREVPTPEQYRRKAMQMYMAQGGYIKDK